MAGSPSIAILGMAAAALSLATGAAASERVPEPPDAPKPRFETWFDYQENANDSGQYKLTAKVYVPSGTGGGWRFTSRVDVPFLYTNKAGSGNPDGDWRRPGQYCKLAARVLRGRPARAATTDWIAGETDAEPA